jgi:hypothetical protein
MFMIFNQYVDGSLIERFSFAKGNARGVPCTKEKG